MRTSGFGESRGSSTSGVLPIDSTMSPKRPPQGRLSSSSRAMRTRYFKKCSEGEVMAGGYARMPPGNPQNGGGPLIGKSRLFLVLALVVAAMAVVVSGCGSSDDNGSSGGGGSSTLTVGSDIPYPPF